MSAGDSVMPFSLTSLEWAVAQLGIGVTSALAEPTNDVVRDAVIYRFALATDLSRKFLDRYLSKHAGVDEALLRRKRDLFREGARLHLLEDAGRWIGHVDARGETSHCCEPAIAEHVLERAVMAAPDYRTLLENLRGATRSTA